MILHDHAMSFIMISLFFSEVTQICSSFFFFFIYCSGKAIVSISYDKLE